MSKIALEGNASGTGTFTIASPNSNSNYTLTLPSSTGTVVVTGGAQTVEFAAGTAAAPSITFTGDTNTGIFSPAADTIAFAEGGAEAMRIDSSGNVGIGTSSPNGRLDVTSTSAGANTNTLFLTNASSNASTATSLVFGVSTSPTTRNATIQAINAGGNAINLAFLTSNADVPTERARITSGGDFVVGKTATGWAEGAALYKIGTVEGVVSGGVAGKFGRGSNDGTIVEFLQDNTVEGTISVSGTTVSYNGGHLSRYAQTQAPKDESLLKGTVLSNLDEMNVYVVPTTYWTEEDELPEGVNVGDVKVETHTVDNEQLNKVKVSDVEGDVNVAGVFVNWSYDEVHQVDEINMAMTGDMIIRIAQGVVVQKGDLLMSAGDGTAKPQGDDIVRSKTVAKVTSNNVTCTYEDGSYCVPCVLMAC